MKSTFLITAKLFLSMLLIGCATSSSLDVQYAKFDIIHTEVLLTVTPGEDSARVEQELIFRFPINSNEINFNTGDFDIDFLELDGTQLSLPTQDGDQKNASGLSIASPIHNSRQNKHKIKVKFRAPLKRGFINQTDLTASAYFSCDWMICNQEDFTDRFTTKLILDVPKGMVTLGPGDKISELETINGQRVRQVWLTSEPFPAYVNAFAVGNLESMNLPSECATDLMLLAPQITGELIQAFSSTCEMISFFESKSGISFPRSSYTQFYVPDTRAAQEAVSHSIIGGIFLDPILENPQEDWVIAHELAHQWWGNRVTAANLSEFWLNEGIVTFMVAAWKEHKWGRAAYEREIELNRSRWKRRIEGANDLPIAFQGDFPSTGFRFSIQYSKGSVFLYELRELVGERAFWDGLADFTASGFDKDVKSIDFEHSMQKYSEIPLKDFFIEWVYGE